MYDHARDVFPHVLCLVVPSALLAIVTLLAGRNRMRDFDIRDSLMLMQFLWTFSICLEAVAIIPQLVLLQKYRDIQPTLAKSILLMGLYRALYILSWVYRAYTEKGYQHHKLVYIAGVAQTMMYADFFYSYLIKCNAAPSDSSADDDTEGSQQAPPLAYTPLLQDQVCCCCNHVAKEEDELQPNDADGESNFETRPNNESNAAAAAPPVLIFSKCSATSGALVVFLYFAGVFFVPALVLVAAPCVYRKGCQNSHQYPSDPSGMIMMNSCPFEDTIQKIADRIKTPEESQIPQAALETPLLQEESMIPPVSGTYHGEDKRTVVRRSTVQQVVSRCSLSFQFVEHEEGWEVEQAGSTGCLFLAQEGDGIESGDYSSRGSSRNESKFVILEGFVSSKTFEGYWVEEDTDGDVKRVVLGRFDPENNSFAGEWQSSDGKQGKREIVLTDGDHAATAAEEGTAKQQRGQSDPEIA